MLDKKIADTSTGWIHLLLKGEPSEIEADL